MKVIAENNPAVIEAAVQVLRSGGIVVFPTETCYGIGADATNQAAVDKVLKYKQRRQGKPLSIAVNSPQMAEQYVELTESARKIYDRLLPGPVTVISKSQGKVASGVESEFGTLGVRWADYNLVGDIVSALGHPITATSANASGKKTPYSINDILNTISDTQRNLIDLIIDAGELPHNPPSTVIDTTLSTPVTMRQGSVPIDANKTATTLTSHSEQETKSIAGKLLLKHWNTVEKSGLILGINGPLGAGKTIFAKGVAEFLGITEPISSPTYTYIEEYEFSRHQTQGKLFHLDVWKVDSADLYQRLEVDQLAKPNTVILIEWWENIANFADITPNVMISMQNEPNQPHQRLLEIVD